MMYKPEDLISLCLEFFGRNNPNLLVPASRLSDHERLYLQRFLFGLLIITLYIAESKQAHICIINKLSTTSANTIIFIFNLHSDDSGTITVANYFYTYHNRPFR